MRGFPLNKETINLRIIAKYGTGNNSYGKKTILFREKS
jgi:hypothetical protein